MQPGLHRAAAAVLPLAPMGPRTRAENEERPPDGAYRPVPRPVLDRVLGPTVVDAMDEALQYCDSG
eukprot:13587144-Alexandrium_andersonii.AAC.1